MSRIDSYNHGPIAVAGFEAKEDTSPNANDTALIKSATDGTLSEVQLTNFPGGGGAGTGWQGTVTDYATLPAAASNSGKVYLVLNSTGLLWNRRRGLYRSDGANWNRLSNAELKALDSETTISDNSDNTKNLKFELSGITTGTTRTMTIPDKDGTVALLSDIVAGSGDVTGPASATDNALARFDTTTGKLIQNSGVIVDDSNNITGVNSITDPDYIDFNTAFAGAMQEGRVAWDSTNGTLQIGMPGGNVTLQVGQEQYIKAKAIGSAIGDGDLVYVSGSTGAVIEATLAKADSWTTSDSTLAMATEAIAENQQGYYTTFGLVRDIDTSSLVEGGKVYLSDSVAGGFTATKVSAPSLCVCVGYCIRQHATEGVIFVNINVDKAATVREVTTENTGFRDPGDVIVTGDSTTRTVTLTGTVEAYYQGEPVEVLVSGWTSSAHGSDTAEGYFLLYDGSSFSWALQSAGFSEEIYKNLLIAFAFYDSTNATWVYIREPHGFMPWQAHREFHQTTGTYRRSGGDLANYTLDSTTAADRRPDVESTLLYDEDLPTTSPVLNSSLYSNFYLSGAGADVNVDISQADIVPLSTARPYWNEFTGGAWQQTLISNNYYMAVWVLCIPMGADTSSQQWRYLWIQGQFESNDLSAVQARTPQDVSIGTLRELLPELVVTNKVIIQYTGGNWKLIQVDSITGTSSSQTTSPAGNYLTSVTSDATLTGQGTTASPIGIDLTNTNAWTGAQSFIDDSFSILNTADAAKIIDFSAASITTANTRTITMADADVDLADIATNTTNIATNTSSIGDATTAKTITGQTVGGSDGDAVYLSSANTWSQCDADAEATASGMIGIRVSATEVQIGGVYTTTGLTAASTYYLSTTAGGITTTAPSDTGDIVRIIGYALSTTELFIDPDKTFVEIV